ncbi:MAG: hypothetical protein GY859_25115, partial [Desulfobacterales bacterium]|nr:hypothetical protein [Desulfobacterales bacterium]
MEGWDIVSPEASIIYTISANGPSGGISRSIEIDVLIPPTVELFLEPAEIEAGGESVLSWAAEHAQIVSIDPGVGPVGPSGSIVVHPAENIRYTITAEGPGGSATASATLNVVADNAEVDLEPTGIDLS